MMSQLPVLQSITHLDPRERRLQVLKQYLKKSDISKSLNLRYGIQLRNTEPAKVSTPQSQDKPRFKKFKNFYAKSRLQIDSPQSQIEKESEMVLSTICRSKGVEFSPKITRPQTIIKRNYLSQSPKQISKYNQYNINTRQRQSFDISIMTSIYGKDYHKKDNHDWLAFIFECV